MECFTSFTERNCGLNSSVTIAPLIRMHYSFEYLPPCSTQVEAQACASAITGSGAGNTRAHSPKPMVLCVAALVVLLITVSLMVSS